MTTNKPEVVAWRWRKPVVNDQGETVGATAWELGDAPEFLPWWTNDPLIRLKDYETLQAECEKLRRDAERYRWIRLQVGVQLTGSQIYPASPYLLVSPPARESIAESTDSAIDAAIAAYRKQGGES